MYDIHSLVVRGQLTEFEVRELTLLPALPTEFMQSVIADRTADALAAEMMSAAAAQAEDGELRAALRQLCAGLPVNPLPPWRPRDDTIPHAPPRRVASLTVQHQKVPYAPLIRPPGAGLDPTKPILSCVTDFSGLSTSRACGTRKEAGDEHPTYTSHGHTLPFY